MSWGIPAVDLPLSVPLLFVKIGWHPLGRHSGYISSPVALSLLFDAISPCFTHILLKMLFTTMILTPHPVPCVEFHHYSFLLSSLLFHKEICNSPPAVFPAIP